MMMRTMERVEREGRVHHVATVEHDGLVAAFTDELGSWMVKNDDGSYRQALPETAAYLQEELRIFDKTAVKDRRKFARERAEERRVGA
jgi:hypothetical protein